MGQAIITSHSPYVIEQFDPEQIVALSRNDDGILSSRNLQLGAIKPKKYQRERRQMAEAVLSRAVLVVEGATEASLFRAASEIMERDVAIGYEHLDLAGISVFNAGADNAVPPYGPFFSDLGKLAFGFYDKQDAPPTAEIQQQLDRFEARWESPEKGIERLLINEITVPTQRRFLEAVLARPDYPAEKGTYNGGMDDATVKSLAFEVLKARKGEYAPYAALLIGECENPEDLPSTVRTVLETMHARLQPRPAASAVPAAGAAPPGAPA
jgi:putative ATP-dependent endonuclease of OLD family